MPAHRYMDEIGLAVKLATKKLTGVIPQVNLMEHVHLCQVQIRLPTLALKPEEMSPEVKNRAISSPTKGLYYWSNYSNRRIPCFLLLKWLGFPTVNN